MKGTLAGPLVEQVTQPGPTIGRRTVPASYSSAHSACNDYSTGSRCLLPTGAGLPHAVKGNQLRVRCAADLQVWWERIFHVRASIRCGILCSCSLADPLPPRNFIKWNFMLRGLAPSARAACLRVRGGKPSKIVDGLGSLRRKLHQQLGYGFLRNWSGTTECKFLCRWGNLFLVGKLVQFRGGKRVRGSQEAFNFGFAYADDVYCKLRQFWKLMCRNFSVSVARLCVCDSDDNWMPDSWVCGFGEPVMSIRMKSSLHFSCATLWFGSMSDATTY